MKTEQVIRVDVGVKHLSLSDTNNNSSTQPSLPSNKLQSNTSEQGRGNFPYAFAYTINKIKAVIHTHIKQICSLYEQEDKMTLNTLYNRIKTLFNTKQGYLSSEEYLGRIKDIDEVGFTDYVSRFNMRNKQGGF